MPKEKREAIEQEQEIFGFMSQSHISDKNIARLKELAISADSNIKNLAIVVLEVAKVKPYKRRRLKFLAKDHKALLDKLEVTGLILAHGID